MHELYDEKHKKDNYKYTEVNKITTFLCCIYFFLSFYENYLTTLIGSSTKYLLIITIIMLVINNKYFLFKWYHVSIVCWFTLKLASVLWATNYTIMKEHIASQIGMVLFFLVMTTVRYDEKFVKLILGTLLYTSASMGILSLFFSDSYHGVVDSRQVLILFGTEMDPNNLAAFYMIGVSLALYYIIYEKKNIILNGLIVILNTYAVGLTGSRGGLITYVSVILFCLIYLNNSKKKIRSLFFKTVFLFGVVISIYLILQAYLPQQSFERIFGLESYEGGSDRDILWGNAYELFMRNPFFGAGWGSYFGYNNYFKAVHNTYLSMLSDVGIIGFTLFFIPIFWVLKRSLLMKIPLAFIIVLTGLIPSIFLDAINKRFFWNAIIVAFVLINAKYGEMRE